MAAMQISQPPLQPTYFPSTLVTSASPEGKWQGKKVVDAKRLPLPEAKWHQKERVMRIVGVAMIALGCLGMLAGAGLLVAGSLSMPAAGIGLAAAAALGLSASFGALTAGIKLLKREYWQDPAFVDAIAEKIQEWTFDEIIHKYGWERTSKQHFISKEKLTEKFLDKIERDSLNYLAVCQSYEHEIRQYQFIDWKSLHPLLMREIETGKMNFDAFKNRYGNQPLVDGVMVTNDPWYVAETLKGIKDKSYAQIKSDFKLEIARGIVSEEVITRELQRQYKSQPSVEAFMQQQGGLSGFWQIINDGVIDPCYFTKDLMQQTKGVPVSTIVKTFGWNIFSTVGMLSGQDFSARFLRDEQQTPFSQILQKFGGQEKGWNIFAFGLIKPAQLKQNALKEIRDNQMTFEQIIANYSWKAFSMKILHGNDAEVRKAFIDLAGKTNFCTLWDTYNDYIAAYNLLPSLSLVSIAELAKRKHYNDYIFSNEIQSHQQIYENSVKHALFQKNRDIENSQKNIDQLDVFIQNEHRRFDPLKYNLETEIQRCRNLLRDVRVKINQQKKTTAAVEFVPAGERQLPQAPLSAGESIPKDMHVAAGERKDTVVHSASTTQPVRPNPSGHVVVGERKDAVIMLQELQAEERRLLAAIPLIERDLAAATEFHMGALGHLQDQRQAAKNEFLEVKRAAQVTYQREIDNANHLRENNKITCQGILKAKNATIDAEFAYHHQKFLSGL